MLKGKEKAKSRRDEDPYASTLGQDQPAPGLEDLLRSPEYSKRLSSQIQQMIEHGLSESEIISRLSRSMDIADQDSGELSGRGFDNTERDIALNPDLVKKNYREGVEMEREKVRAIAEVVRADGDDSELAREIRERDHILKIVQDNADDFSEQFAKKAQRSIQSLSDQIEDARGELREFVEESPEHVVMDEALLDSVMGQKTVQRLTERLPENRDAIRSTIDELMSKHDEGRQGDVSALVGPRERRVVHDSDGEARGNSEMMTSWPRRKI